jgi:hypothetical protein
VGVYVRERSAKLSGRDIAMVWDKETDSWLPGFVPVYTPEGIKRRQSCRMDLRRFLLTYASGSFFLKLSEDHEQLIKETQQIILGDADATSVVVAMPRGSGKTTILWFAVLWAVLYGHHKFVMLIAADDPSARKLLKRIKGQLQRNDLLNDDFPEICGPIRALEGSAIRGLYQLYNGVPTDLQFGADMIVFPTIPEGVERHNAGCVIAVGGLESAIRGQSYTAPSTGETYRPTLALVDDPQTRKTAKSKTMSEERWSIITSDIYGLSGPTTELSLLVAGTIIYKNDLMYMLLDPQVTPGWATIRVSMLKEWPKRTDLVEEYRKMRELAHLEKRKPIDADKFYADNQKEIERGAVTYWPERFPKKCISSLHFALNIWIDKPETFASEYQNSPEDPHLDQASELSLTEEILVSSVAELPPMTVPRESARLTAMIDVSQRILWWSVVSFSESFAGHVTATGTWPEQNGYVTKDKVDLSLQQMYGMGLRDSIKKGIEDLMDWIVGQSWQTEDGTVCQIDGGLVDSRWGEMSKLLRSVVWNSPYRATWYPSEPVGMTAKQYALNESKVKPGTKEERGLNWRLTQEREGKRAVWDANFWKSFTARLWHDQKMHLHAGNMRSHRMLFDQLLAEYSVETEARRIVHEWRPKPGQKNEHLWDCIVGATVRASIAGVRPVGEEQKPRRARIRYGG